MKLNNLQNRKVQISLYFRERLSHDPFVCQKIIKVDGVHRYEKKYYRISDIEECIKSAETFSELTKDNDKLEIIVEIYLDNNDNAYYEKNAKILENINKELKIKKISSYITRFISKFL